MKKDASMQNSILDYDQLNELVVKNRTFLRDFLLVICGLIIFVILAVFVLLIFAINQTVEDRRARAETFVKTYEANLDYRKTTPDIISNVIVPINPHI